MAEPRKWTVMECEMGHDLRHRRCHLAPRCDVPGGCNDEDHYCMCLAFLVAEVLPVAATGETQRSDAQ